MAAVNLGAAIRGVWVLALPACVGFLLIVGLRPAASSSGASEINGIVANAMTGDPIERALITLRSRNVAGTTATVRSDRAGRFRVVTQAPTDTLSISASGFAVYKRAAKTLTANAPTTFGLTPAATLRGAISYSDSGTAVDATVVLRTQTRYQVDTKATRSVNGRFQFDGVVPASAMLVVHGRNVAPSVRYLHLAPGATADIDVSVHQPGRVSGFLSNAVGSPIRGVLLEVLYRKGIGQEKLLGNLVGGQVKTAADGHFHIGGIVPRARFVLRAKVGAEVFQSEELVLEPGQERSGVLLSRQ